MKNLDRLSGREGRNLAGGLGGVVVVGVVVRGDAGDGAEFGGELKGADVQPVVPSQVGRL